MDIFNCECGFSWQRGKSGDHSCSPYYRAKVESLEARIKEQQQIIDSRPALNAGLVEAYTNWTHAIYAGDVQRAMKASGIKIVEH